MFSKIESDATGSPRPAGVPLQVKILTSFVLIVAVLLGVGFWVGTPALERRVQEELVRFLDTAGGLMEDRVVAALQEQPTVERVQPLAEALGRRASCRVTIIDEQGRVVGDSSQTLAGVRAMENHADRPEVQRALTGETGRSLRYSATLKEPLLYVARPLYGRDRVLGVLRLALPLTAATELRQEIRRALSVSVLIGLALSALLGFLLARRIAAPLRQLTRRAESYARGEFDVPPLETPSVLEVRELAENLQTMVEAVRSHIAALTGERNQARAVLESLLEGVIAIDSEGTIVSANPSVAQLLGATSTDLTGRGFFETVRQQELQAVARVVLEQRTRVVKDVTVFQPKERLLRVRGVPCEQGGPGGPSAVLVIQDLTESNRYEALRKEFVANVSHELKSPLTAIRSLTETLLDGGLEDAANNRRFVQLIDEDAARLTRLIDDLLALSQIESQAVPLRRMAVPLARFVADTVAPLESAAKRRGVTLTMRVPDDLTIDADPDRLYQVLDNLLDNAIKYNRDGGTVALSAREDDGRVVIEVADTGIGIPEDDLPRVFERFYRVDKARSRELGGTGLGLSIVKHIVESHGGQVSVDSRLGQGSTFRVVLPARA